MLNDHEYKNKPHYFNKLHENSPYQPPETIGYDFNYNKFAKHGIELRIFDYIKSGTVAYSCYYHSPASNERHRKIPKPARCKGIFPPSSAVQRNQPPAAHRLSVT